MDAGSEAPAASGGNEAATLEGHIRRIQQALRLRIAIYLGLGLVFVLLVGPAILLLPREILLVGIPLVLVVEFAVGFVLSGKLMALSITRHHDRLRSELIAQQDRARKALVGRWLSLDPAERSVLRGKFPDLDWDMIDRLAGTDGEGSTRH